MYHTIDPLPLKALAAFPGLPATRSGLDAFSELTAALAPMWSMHRETDYEGDVAMIVLPDDGHAGPAFLLYEKDGLTRVGTVSGDEWTGDEGFSSIQAAISALIAKTVSAGTAGPTGGEMATPAAVRTAVD